MDPIYTSVLGVGIFTMIVAAIAVIIYSRKSERRAIDEAEKRRQETIKEILSNPRTRRIWLDRQRRKAARRNRHDSDRRR